MVNQSFSLNIENLVEYITRGHAFDKHILGYDCDPAMKRINAFRAESSNRYFDDRNEQWVESKDLGDDLFIETPDDLADYILNHFLKSEHTIGYVSPEYGSVSLLNTKDNVAAHFSWNDGLHDFGSIYRYPETDNRFLATLEHLQGNLLPGQTLQEFNNADDPDAAMKAVEKLIEDINDHPQNYLLDSRYPDSTVQNWVLGNAARPGRNWDFDEIWNAPHNVKGHSQAYAEHHGLDVDPEAYVCIQSENDKALDIGRISKSLRSGRVLREINLGPSLEFEATIAPEAA